MRDDDENLSIGSIGSSSPLHDFGLHPPDGRGDRKDHRHRKRRRPKDFLQTIQKATEESNRKLSRQGTPVRFCIYMEKGRLMLDMAYLDDSGAITRVTTRDVTDADFDQLIEDISNIEGLQFDQRA